MSGEVLNLCYCCRKAHVSTWNDGQYRVNIVIHVHLINHLLAINYFLNQERETQ